MRVMDLKDILNLSLNILKRLFSSNISSKTKSIKAAIIIVKYTIKINK